MAFFFVIVFIILFIVLVNYASKDDSDSCTTTPKNINSPLSQQDIISNNQDYYNNKVLHNKFNFNDWLNIHPGNENLGEYGEFLTSKAIVAACKRYGGYYKLLQNLYLHTPNGTTEIDIVLIHSTGIYVFESKNFTGQISGQANQKDWIKITNNTKKLFYNPIWQNDGHISALRHTIGKNLKYESFIVFSERCILKNVPKDIPGRTILHRNNLENVLCTAFSRNGASSNGEPHLSINAIDELYAKLPQCTNSSDDLPF